MNRAYLLLGSNIDKERNIVEAFRLLSAAARVAAASSVYETDPVGNANQDRFLNAAVLVETPLSAAALKREVLGPIEARLGRRRSAERNAPRTIDLDIVLFNERPMNLDDLTRGHVVTPLAEIAPEFRPAPSWKTLAELAAEASQAGVTRRADLSLDSGPEPSTRRG